MSSSNSNGDVANLGGSANDPDLDPATIRKRSDP